MKALQSRRFGNVTSSKSVRMNDRELVRRYTKNVGNAAAQLPRSG